MKRLCCFVSLAFIAGCGLTSSEVVAPSLDPAEAAVAAIAEYDSDGDGKISGAEAKKSALDPKKGWDANRDGSITEDEVLARLERYEALKPGIQAMTCTVLFRGEPLPDAEVVFEPEAFLGGAVETATGTTDGYGIAEMVAEEVAKKDPTLRGIRAALYKVRITHPDLKLPTKYNEDTTLFFELAPMDNVLSPTFRLGR